MIANPIRVGGTALPRRAAPALGEQTDALLAGLGYSAERIVALRRDKVVA